MKYIIAGLVGVFGFVGVASAAKVGSMIVQSTGLWGYVEGQVETWVYRLPDKENGVMCYVSYYGKNSVPDMECVKVK